MAGPRQIATGQVVNATDNLSRALGTVTNMYTDHVKEAENKRRYEAENSRTSALFNEQMGKFKREEDARNFLQTYDPRLGEDGRGINSTVLDSMYANERELVDRYMKTADGQNPEKLRTFTEELVKNRANLLDRDSARTTIYDDAMRTGLFTPEQASAYAEGQSQRFRSLNDLVAQDQANAEARTKAAEARMLAHQWLLGEDTKLKQSYNQMQGQAARGSTGGAKGTGAGGRFDSLLSIDDLNSKFSAKGYNLGWLDNDRGRNTVILGTNAVNDKYIKKGNKPLPPHVVDYATQTYLDLQTGWFGGNSLKSYDEDKFAAHLERTATELATAGAFDPKTGQVAGGFNATTGISGFNLPADALDNALSYAPTGTLSRDDIFRNATIRSYDGIRNKFGLDNAPQSAPAQQQTKVPQTQVPQAQQETNAAKGNVEAPAFNMTSVEAVTTQLQARNDALKNSRNPKDIDERIANTVRLSELEKQQEKERKAARESRLAEMFDSIRKDSNPLIPAITREAGGNNLSFSYAMDRATAGLSPGSLVGALDATRAERARANEVLAGYRQEGYGTLSVNNVKDILGIPTTGTLNVKDRRRLEAIEDSLRRYEETLQRRISAR